MISWPEPDLPPINLYNAPEQPTMKRPRRWLKIGKDVNTLRGHMKARGISLGWSRKLGEQNHCKPSDVPLSALRRFFGCNVENVPQPENWQEIMYGSKRGDQKKAPKGKSKSTYAEMKKKEVEDTPEVVQRFMKMTLSQNPANYAVYY